MVILNISEFFPAPIQAKERDNDIVLITAAKHTEFFPEAQHFFVLTIPFVSLFTSFLIKEWKPFRFLAQQKKYSIQGQEIQVIPVFMRGYSILFLRPLLNRLSYFLHRKRWIEIIRKENVSLLHAHNVHHTAYIAARLSKELNIPYVITSRKILASLNSTAVKELLTGAEAIISINHIYKKKIDDLIPSIKSHLIAHGIDHHFLNAPLKNHDTNSTPVKLVSISRLLPLKNIEQTLRVLETIPLPFVYHIYGDGPDQNRLQTLLSTLSIKDKVQFMGHVAHSRIPGILSRYDVFVLPSYPEVLGRAYFEAMSIGLPVIASRNTGVDGFIQDGISGLLVDHNSHEELQRALIQLMKDSSLRSEIGTAGKELMANFSWEKMILKLHSIYTSSIIHYKKKNQRK